MEKTLRYLLIAAMISLAGAWSMVNAVPQGIATEPQIDMHSTSMMVGSGSHLPMAAESGAITTDGEEAGVPKGGPRRISGGNSGGGSGPSNPDDPYATPIGDAALPLALLACAYLILRVARRRAKGGRTA